MFENINSIVFDLDDTLHNQRFYIFTKFKYISSKLAEQLNRSENELFFSMCKLYDECWWRSKIFDMLFEEPGFRKSPDLIKHCISLYHNCPHGSESLFPETIPVLEHLKKTHNLGLLTDGKKEDQENKIKSLGLTKYFDVILILEDKNEKPSAYGFNEITGLLGSPQQDILYVGDNPYRDIYGALKTEMQICWLKGYSYWKDKPLPFFREKNITEVNNLSELIKLV